ncbi:cyclic lactone autoinducer peptide [Aneurinibacillus migulanus]|nr:cyclic lactone autoinducer peptide [Aneurinibacillus migulanus]
MKKALYATTSFFTLFAAFIVTSLSVIYAHAPETPEELR